ncbi:MAG: hypothetical protein IJ484_06715 [Oscillospiraceae bacterium]|nr:hypothetical protein [Oscillospiraceae bacterium]
MRKNLVSILFAAVLFLLLAACSRTPGWERVDRTMTKLVDQGRTKEAVQMGLDWLEQTEEDYDLWEEHDAACARLAQLYKELGDEAAERAFLLRAAELTGDEVYMDAFLSSASGGTFSLKDVESAFPEGSSLTLFGAPFADWTVVQLRQWLPTNEDTYYGEETGDDYYISTSFKNADVTVYRYGSGEDYGRMGIRFDSLDRYRNYYDMDVSLPELPCGVEQADDMAAVMEKLGLPGDVAQALSAARTVTFTLYEDRTDLWVYLPDDELSDGRYRDFTICYDNADYYGEVTFHFYDSVLSSYELSRNL